MANTGGTQGGSHEQHGKPGEQNRKQAGNPQEKPASGGAGREKSAPGTRGPEQHVKPGHQGPKSS